MIEPHHDQARQITCGKQPPERFDMMFNKHRVREHFGCEPISHSLRRTLHTRKYKNTDHNQNKGDTCTYSGKDNKLLRYFTFHL